MTLNFRTIMKRSISTAKLQHIYARHLGGDELNGECKSWYTPNVEEVVKLAR